MARRKLTRADFGMAEPKAAEVDALLKNNTLEELLLHAAEITADLKLPMSNVQRAWLVADRTAIRAAIAKAAQP